MTSLSQTTFSRARSTIASHTQVTEGSSLNKIPIGPLRSNSQSPLEQQESPEMREHRRLFHDPRDLSAEPCCFECCDCQDAGDDD